MKTHWLDRDTVRRQVGDMLASGDRRFDRPFIHHLGGELGRCARRHSHRQRARRDEADRAALEKQREVVSSELRHVSKGRGAMAAYTANPGAPGAMYQDRQG